MKKPQGTSPVTVWSCVLSLLSQFGRRRTYLLPVAESGAPYIGEAARGGDDWHPLVALSRPECLPNVTRSQASSEVESRVLIPGITLHDVLTGRTSSIVVIAALRTDRPIY